MRSRTSTEIATGGISYRTSKKWTVAQSFACQAGAVRRVGYRRVMLLKETTSGRDLSGLSAEELEDGIAEWAAHMSAGMCRWLELVGELDSRGSHGLGGPESCAAWLA